MVKYSSVFNVASKAFGIIPGLAIISTSLGVPPDSSRVLFGGIIEALGVMTLIILWINHQWIKDHSIRQFNRLFVIAVVVFIISLFAYIFLFRYAVEEVPYSDSLYFPFWPQGELLDGLIQHNNSRAELIKAWGRSDVYKVINASSKNALLVTTLILLFIYQLVFVALTFCFGILGIRASITDTESSH